MHVEFSFLKQVLDFLNKQRQRRRWRAIVTCLAAVVVFVTTYLFILPAITMENRTFCGKEEHIHTEECYELQLTCHKGGMDENAEAASSEGEIEPLAYEEDAPDDGEDAPVKDSGTPESWGDLSDREDSQDKNDLQEESNGWENSDVPETPSEEPQEELEGEHVHTEDCYTSVLTCEKEEHTHTEACQIQLMSAPLDEEVIDGGDLTETMNWAITEDDEGNQTLWVSGTGDMPDFKSQNDQPWRDYCETTYKIVVEDGVTSVGAHAFHNFRVKEIELGADVEVIDTYGFAYGAAPSLTIPGNVKVIAEHAFAYSSDMKSIVLEEGVETIEKNAFVGTSLSGELHLPASLQEIGSTGIGHPHVSAYLVAEGNETFFSRDGVLFERLEDGSIKLCAYPSSKPDWEYEIPADVSEIQGWAFRETQKLEKLTIPNTVTVPIKSETFRDGSLVEVVIEDGVTFDERDGANVAFARNKNLRTVQLPDNVAKKFDRTFQDCTSLETFRIPRGIETLSSDTFTNCTSLETLLFDAENCTSISAIFGTKPLPRFELVIGQFVNLLCGPQNGSAGFSTLVEHADSIHFQGPNSLIIEEGAMDKAVKPLTQLVGTVYVDEEGVVYQYDAESETAVVAYCPPELVDCVIPASIQPEEGVTCAVTGVGENAFLLADELTSIVFEAPEQITEIASMGFANCATLTSVNGENTVEGATASFTNEEVKIGYNAFYGTGLLGAGGTGDFEQEMDGSKALTITDPLGEMDTLHISVSSGGQTMEWQEGENAGKGGYRLLTGDTMTVNLSVGNTEGSNTSNYRVYFELTDESGSLSITPGQTYTFDGVEVACHATEAPNIVYLEFHSQIGRTVSIPVTVTYPSPSSSGGGLQIWGSAYRDGEDPALVLVPEDSIQAYWTTQSDLFELTKENKGTASTPIIGDGKGGAQPKSDLVYQITLSRQNEMTSPYGKDYVRSVDYMDTPDFPEGVSWREEVLESIRNNDIHRTGNTLYAGNTKLAVFSLNGATLSGVRVTWDESTGQVTFHWRAINPDNATEMGTNTVEFTIAKEALAVDTEVFGAAQDGHIITNTANATVHYHYEEDLSLTDQVERTLTIGVGSLNIEHTASDVTYFGEDINYSIRLYNDSALPYTGEDGVYTLVDTMSPYTYISPENMEKMFREEYGKNLTIEIRGAELAAWEPVLGIDGKTTTYRNTGNSDLNAQENVTLHIGWNAEKTAFQVEADGKHYTGATPQEALRKAGYAVTQNVKNGYTLTWTLNEEESFTLNGGEERLFQVYATAKNSFEITAEDWQNQYPVERAVTIQNQVKVHNPENAVVVTRSVNSAIKREAFIMKSVSRDGTPFSKDLKDFSVEDQDVLDYTLEFRHYGSGVYKNLPMVDDLYGTQYLLVPVDKNASLAGRGLRVHEKDGVKSYVLTEGTYQNVVVGIDDTGSDCMAATITVTAADEETEVRTDNETDTYTGLHTQIKWYFPELSDEGNYKITVQYQALVDMELLHSVSYSIGNIVWMNDKVGNRLYDRLWGGGTIIDFNKEILVDDGNGNVTVDADGYSLLSEGDQVTYRLTLQNKGNSRYVLHGQDIVDQLPKTGGTFQWERGVNVSLRYESTSERTKISGLEDWEISDRWLGVIEPGQQYLIWPDDAKIEFNDRAVVYLYVTLTFPGGEGDHTTWERYCTAMGGETLLNTFYVYHFPVNVSHNLREAGEVLLQKGVYGTSWYNSQYRYTETQNRLYYSNKDVVDRAVAYYVVLYNGGNTRLYVDKLYDELPKGFTFQGMIKDSGFASGAIYARPGSVVTEGGSTLGSHSLVDVDLLDTQFSDVTFRSASVTRNRDADGLEFDITRGSGDYAIKYDEERERYYLDRGEAIVFGYLCEIGLTSETEDTETNVIGMAYDDYLGAGVQTVAESDLLFTGTETELHTDFNDGTCVVTSGAEAQNYGFPAESTDQWLVSNVTISRGEVVPGVTKETESYTQEQTGTTLPYVNNVMPTDTVNWRVRLHNSGTMSMTDYTISDTMPAPYCVEGIVHYSIYDFEGTALYTQDLLEVEAHSPDASTIRIKRLMGMPSDWMTLTVNGEPLLLKENEVDLKCEVSFERDDYGNETLNLRMEGRKFSIPEGGFADLELSSRNPTKYYENTVYINQAMLSPNAQEYNRVGQGSLVKDENGNFIGVRNSSPVNVSFGYATSSEKRVEEVGNPQNVAVSINAEQNYILLPEYDSVFRYSLTVSNDTDNAMTKLVLIDGLPEVDDHSPFSEEAPRGSAFQVSLAENPKVSVVVTKENGEQTELTRAQYTLEYSTKTEFTTQDWNGEMDHTWQGNAAGARSLRVQILDQAGTLIPSGAKVTVAFNARIDGVAEPGTIAWNSFGYHYGLKDVSQELEAMPLVVGVKVPTVPNLQKKLVDRAGTPVNAESDLSFRFLIHTGGALEHYDDPSALADRKVTIVDLKVGAGQNESEVKSLTGLQLWRWDTGSNEWMEDTIPWEWVDGETYTVLEWQTNENYTFHRFQEGNNSAYTFSYVPDQQTTITCENVFLKWAISLTKVDEKDTSVHLAGAVFALYSSEQKDALPEEEYQLLTTKPERELTLDGKTWYLQSVKTTDEEGTIQWEGLNRSQYYLLEVKAPDGYQLNDPAGQYLSRDHAAGGSYTLMVSNTSGYILPETGGSGTLWYITGGIFLLLLACLLYKCKKQRKGEMIF